MLRTSALLTVTLLGLSPPASAAALGDTIAFAPHGDALAGSAGAPLPLTPRSLLVGSRGPNGVPTDADDEILLVTDLDGAPTVTPLAAPGLPEFSPAPSRLSATRALALGSGADGVFGTADDVLHLLDDLGGANAATPIEIGFLTDQHQSVPVPLAHDAIAMATLGPDGVVRTADDEIVVVSDLGGSNAITRLAAPFLTSNGSGRPAALSPTALVVASAGPDALQRTADDLLYVFRDLTGTPERTELDVPFTWHDGRAGVPKRLDGASGLLSSAGLDGVKHTADDEVYLLLDLDSTPTALPLSVPFIQFEAADVLVLGPDLAVMVTSGPDGDSSTPDDELAILSDLAGVPGVEHVAVGPVGSGADGRPVLLTEDRVGLAGLGPDQAGNGADDEVVVVSGLRGDPEAEAIPVGPLGRSAGAMPTALGAGALLINAGGADALETGDDELASVTGIGSAPEVERLPIPGGVGGASSNTVFVTQPLGEGRAVQVRRGANALGAGGDDTLQLLEGLPDDRRLDVRKLRIRFDATRPQKGEKLSLAAAVALDGLPLPGTGDLTVSLGNVSQTLPADALVVGRKTIRYADKRGQRGFVRKLLWKPATGKLEVKGKGIGTGLAGLDPAYLPVAVEYDGVYLSSAPAGEAVARGIRFRAP